ncbi:MAG: thioredoxin [Cyclobacteriaceae bacterium]
MNFSEIINSPTPVLVDFYADWCGPCKMMAPILKEVADDMNGKMKVLKVDVDRNQKAAAKYGIRSIPTMILFQKGKILWRHAGAMQKSQLINTTSQFIKEDTNA